MHDFRSEIFGWLWLALVGILFCTVSVINFYVEFSSDVFIVLANLANSAFTFGCSLSLWSSLTARCLFDCCMEKLKGKNLFQNVQATDTQLEYKTRPIFLGQFISMTIEVAPFCNSPALYALADSL